MERIRIYAMTLLLMIVAAVAQAQPSTLPGNTGINDVRVLNIWGSMYSGNGAGGSWENWGASISEYSVAGITTEKIDFSTGSYVGYTFYSNPQDLSGATHMNVWVWADQDTQIGLQFQSKSKTGAYDEKYQTQNSPLVTGGQWNLIRVAISEMPLSGNNPTSTMSDIEACSIVQNDGKTIYVSDIFFTEENNVITRNLVNGTHYKLWDTDETWGVMRDFFSKNADGTWTFKGVSGNYRLRSDIENTDGTSNYIKVEPLNSDGTVSLYDTTTGEGGLWLRGSGNLGMPSYILQPQNWTQDGKYAYAMSEVTNGTYQTTMTIDKELAPTGGVFKLFNHYTTYGDGFKPSSSEESADGRIDFSNGHYIFQIPNNGDITQKSGLTLRTGDEWQFEVTATANTALSFSANRVWLSTQNLQPAPTPTVDASKVLSVFSDAYTVNIGMKKSHWSNVITWGPDAKEQTRFDGDGNHTEIAYRTYADAPSNQVAVFEFKVDDSDNDRGWLNLHLDQNVKLSDYKTLHLDVNDLDGLNNEIYIWPRVSHDDAPTFNSVSGKSTLKFNLLDGRDANGWKSIEIPISEIIGLAGNANGTVSDGDYISHIGIQAANANTKGAIAIDNVYFSTDNDLVTYDNDERGIDWNTATGTTCYVDQIVWTKSGTTAGVNIVDTYNDNWAKIHDGDVHSYFQFNHDDTNDDNEHSQVLIRLKDDIKVSDVEVIWANGYASRYAVYAFENYPVVNGEIPSSALTRDNRLYYVGGYMSDNAADDMQMDHEPYYVIKSELQKEVTHDSRYILLDLKKRGNGDTFGYYIDEVHVGAYDEDYNTPDHLNFPVTVIQTELPPTELKVTVRNKRNAVLSEWTSKIVPGSVKTSWDSPLLKNDNNRQTWVYATAPGNFDVTVTGSVEGVTNLVPGKSAVKAYKNWKPASEESDWTIHSWKSLVQPRIENLIDNTKTAAENQTELNSIVWASQYENWGNPARTYYAWKAADGVEATDDHSRWSSAQEDTNNNNPSKQYWVIDLEHTYELTDVELVWERAIAKTYSVFGFTSLDGVDLGADYDTFLSTYGNANDHHLIYSYTMDNVLEYPYHDQHTNSSTESPVREDNRARYLVVKTKETQSTKYYSGTSYSIWEVYAWGADVTVTDNVTNLKTDNLSVKVGHEGVVDVTAYGTKDGTYIEESEWHPVEFSVPASSNYYIKNVENTDPSTGKTVDQYFLFKKVEGQAAEQYNTAYALAYIVDNDNGTYGVKVMPGIKGLGQTKDVYDEDNGATDTKSITINMSSTNTRSTEITGQFELVIYKDAMKLLTDGTSSNKRQVYDDGYYSEDVLKNNITAETVTIDLRNVDFSYDNAGTALNHSVLPAPHTVTKGTGASKVQLNPNTIYYTDEPYTDESTGTISGGNLAFRQGEVWRVPVLRIFDGWDWEPINNEGGMIATSASFYTSIPAKHYSFIALPFAPDISYFSSKNIKLYKPTAFRPERNAVKVDEISSFTSNEIGHPLVIYTEDAYNYRENGYAVVFKSAGTETSVNYFPGKWENNGATIIPSYTKQTLEESDASFDYYLYSIKNDQFLKVGNSELAEDQWNGNEQGSGDQPHLSASQVMPFYAYMKVRKQASPAPAFTFMLTDDTETTGIDATNTETDESVRVYDVQGRYVSDSSRNLTPGMYIIKRADGSTRKVYIKK